MHIVLNTGRPYWSNLSKLEPMTSWANTLELMNIILLLPDSLYNPNHNSHFKVIIQHNFEPFHGIIYTVYKSVLHTFHVVRIFSSIAQTNICFDTG